METGIGNQREEKLEEVTRKRLDKDALLESVDKFLRQLLKSSQLDLHFRCEPEEAVINVRLHGHDAGIVLSNNARVLYAINHLLNQIFFRQSADGFNFVVDCNDYRATRELELQLLAKKAAEKVRTLGSPFALQPMPAIERRVIHVTLAEEAGVKTVSEGMGDQRRVVIVPAK